MRIFALICLMISVKFASAQHEGDVWVFGDSCGIRFDSVPNFFQTSNWSTECNSSISDKNGNLLYYAGAPNPWSGPPPNTIYVWDSTHSIIQNGNLIFGNGSTTQGALLLPNPADSNLIFLFSIAGSIKYNVINRATNMIDSLNILLNDSVTEKLCAIRHGNGRDWWVIAHHDFSDAFIRILITVNGITMEPLQHIGYSLNNTGLFTAGQMVFSPVGNKLCYVNLTGMVELFDFDRCDGLLSNNVHLADTFNGTWPILNSYYGASFSPDGSKLYASKFDSLFQFDLNAPNIAQSRTLVARQPYDSIFFGQHLLGPDGKIYIASTTGNFTDSTNETSSLDVINFPDSSASACGASLYSFSLNGYHSLLGLPNIPNYHLGADSGSVCDTLTGISNINHDELNATIYPNPAKDIVTISLAKEKIKAVVLINLQDEILFTQKITNSNTTTLNLQNYPPGFYLVKITGANYTVVRKIIKE